MAYIGQVIISIQVSGGKTVNISYPNATYTNPAQNAASPGNDITISLTAGRTTVPVPAGATMFVGVPAVSSANAKTWDASSTVGGSLGTNTPFAMPCAGLSSIYIGSVGNEAIEGFFI